VEGAAGPDGCVGSSPTPLSPLPDQSPESVMQRTAALYQLAFNLWWRNSVSSSCGGETPAGPPPHQMFVAGESARRTPATGGPLAQQPLPSPGLPPLHRAPGHAPGLRCQDQIQTACRAVPQGTRGPPERRAHSDWKSSVVSPIASTSIRYPPIGRKGLRPTRATARVRSEQGRWRAA